MMKEVVERGTIKEKEIGETGGGKAKEAEKHM